MPAVFTGRWTRAQILTQALQRAGNMKVAHLARDRLNRLLEETYSQWEWPFLYTEYTFTMPSGNTGGVANYVTFDLPSDFLKTESETTGLLIRSRDGLTVDLPIIEVDPISFRRKAVPHDSTQDRCLFWYVDYANRKGVTWPTPTATLGCALLYKKLPPDVAIGEGGNLGASSDPTTQAYDADIPLFPWHGFLAAAMEHWARDYDNDPQARVLEAQIWGDGGMLSTIRNIAMPRQSQSQVIDLDPQIFGPGFRDEGSRYFRDWDWGW